MAKHAHVSGSHIGRHGRVAQASVDGEGSSSSYVAAAPEPTFADGYASTPSSGGDASSESVVHDSMDPSLTGDLTQPLESVPVDPTPAPRYGQYGQAPEEAPRYAVPPTPLYDTREEPVPLRSWFVAILLASIPFVNIVVLIVYAFGRTQSASQRNWARALLLWAVIVSLCAVFLTVIGILHPAQWAAIL